MKKYNDPYTRKLKSPYELKLVKGLTKLALDLIAEGKKVYLPVYEDGGIDMDQPATQEDVLHAIAGGAFELFYRRVGAWNQTTSKADKDLWLDENPNDVEDQHGNVYRHYGRGGEDAPDAPKDWPQGQDEVLEALIAGGYAKEYLEELTEYLEDTEVHQDVSEASRQSQGAFARAWTDLQRKGYSPIPLYAAGTIQKTEKGEPVDRSKTPCLREWTNYCNKLMTAAEAKRNLRRVPDAEVGVCGGFNGLIGIDIDTLDEELQQAIQTVFPLAPTRIGNPDKAGLLLVRWAGEGLPPNRKFLDKNGKVIVELKGPGSQFVMPPSIWPGKADKETGKVFIEPRPYAMAEGEVPAVDELPKFNEAHVDALLEVLKPYLKERKKLEKDYAARTEPLSETDRPRYEAYAQAGLKREADELARVEEGGRNNALFDAVCKLGRYVHHGVIDKEELLAALEEACGEKGNRYIADDGYSAFHATVESGLLASKDDLLPDLNDPAAHAVAEINKDHAFINNRGGRACILHESFDEYGRPREYYYSVSDFRNIMANKGFVLVRTGKSEKLVAKSRLWMVSPERRSYRGVVFDPSTTDREVNGFYNLWRGFGVEPKKGEWPRLRHHILEVASAADQDFDDYVIRWLAWAVQNPDKQAECALVFKGPRGGGKGTLGKPLVKMFGRHGLHLSSPSLLTGRFTGHLENCAFVFADESLWAGDKAAEQQLKRMITEPTLIIEGKGRDAFQTMNRLKIMMASNENWVAPVGPHERRYAISNTSEARLKDRTYFDALYKEIENGGLSAMLYDLLEMDLSDWHPRYNIPETEALKEQARRSLSPEMKWMLSLLQEGRLPDPTTKPNRTTMTALLENARAAIGRKKAIGDQEIVELIKTWAGAEKVHTNTGNVWEFPLLAQLRTKFDQGYGSQNWTEPFEWQRS